ncbi:MAG: alpha/beta hydrolase, partial [Planctomycetales bacterium]|nr:alpha/beta hydrolase [Planctomycetales bacterium]
KRPELSNARFVLLGFSEGTMVASLVAERKENDIAALMLVGYAHENLYDIIKWQFSGESSMRNLRPPFDANQDDDISREEFESSEDVPTAWREKVLQGVSFDSLDRNSDGVLTVEDYRILLAPHYKMLLEKIEANDADWVWDNFFRVSIEWLNEHFQLEPNKVRLLRLDMPIHVFHGKRDANCDVEGVYDLRRSFEEAGKDNLRTWIFDDHDHQLNFFDWIFKDKMSKGYQRLFEVASELRDPVFTSNTQK